MSHRQNIRNFILPMSYTELVLVYDSAIERSDLFFAAVVAEFIDECIGDGE